MLTIVLQAGGQSSRMGTDKALLPFLGVPLIERLRDRFQDLGRQTLVITNEPAHYQFLGLPIFTDIVPGRGALGGLLTALEVSSTEFIGLIAADMPFASPQLLDHLVDLIQKTGTDAVLPSSDHGPEPLHAVYRRLTCLPLVRSAVEQDLWRMNAWHDQARVTILDTEETSGASSSAHTFINLNTPQDLTDAEALALKLDLI